MKIAGCCARHSCSQVVPLLIAPTTKRLGLGIPESMLLRGALGCPAGRDAGRDRHPVQALPDRPLTTDDEARVMRRARPAAAQNPGAIVPLRIESVSSLEDRRWMVRGEPMPSLPIYLLGMS